ncbi:helix-turn-helix domain-containing protein [Bacteroidota bacterium]
MFITINLDKLLREHDISHEELSEKIGVSKSDLSLLMRIKIKDPRFIILQNICKELNCKPFDIIEFNCDETTNHISEVSI